MEIVRKEIEKKVENFKYFGFLSYLLNDSDLVRNILFERLLAFHDLGKSDLSHEEHYNDTRSITYDLKIIEKNGNVDEFDLSVNDVFDDLVLFLSLQTKEKISLTDFDCHFQYNFYIICDSKDKVFDKYIIKDSDLRKVVAINKNNLKLVDNNILDFHLTVQLDCIDEVEIKDEFDHIMYLLKHNRPYDENHPIYKEILRVHNEYLNSDYYTKDIEYELERVRKMVIQAN